jgi:surface polysaccharide O-acyltransferase-like enzyme
MKHPPTPSSGLLAGIEWMRGLAAFGVICIHSGLAVHNHTTPSAAILRNWFSFTVPFFLLLSFFFAIRTAMSRTVPWDQWMHRYVKRLFVPFVFWSIVYLGLHVAKYSIHHQTGELKGLLEDDPASLILSGGTSVALYFLPLLFSGLVFLRVAAPLLKRLPILGLLTGFLIGIILHHLSVVYLQGMDFKGLVFAPLNLCLGMIENVARCIPLVFVATLLNRCLTALPSKPATPIITLGLTILLVANFFFLSFHSAESFLGLGAFLIAWGLSGVLSLTPSAFIVGHYSFGVYLVHQVFLELIQVFIPYDGIVGIGGTLLITTVTFAVSMMTVWIASRSGSSASRVFGLK